MCQDLKDELEIGRKAARELVEHVMRMGAGSVTMPVEHERIKWNVIVELQKAQDGR